MQTIKVHCIKETMTYSYLSFDLCSKSEMMLHYIFYLLFTTVAPHSEKSCQS